MNTTQQYTIIKDLVTKKYNMHLLYKFQLTKKIVASADSLSELRTIFNKLEAEGKV